MIPLPARAITHPVIAALRDAGYTVTLQDEASGVAVRVTRGDLDLVVRAREAGAALAWVGQWLVSVQAGERSSDEARKR